jgi:hypothetical protein
MSDQIILPNLDNAQDLQILLNNFFKGNQLEKETLRTYILEQLTIIKQKLHQQILTEEKCTFWNKVHDLAYLSKQDISIAAVNQICSLPSNVSSRINESVSSTQTFELFIKLKAAEISSNDKLRDYFLAMKIRNDQLLASMYVYTQSIVQLEFCLSYEPSNVLKHPSFVYFGETSIEDRVYEIAQKLYEARLKLKLL